MPMYCPVCEYHEESRETQCPKCGSPMRYSLLAGLEFEGDQSGMVKVGGGEGPTAADRIQQIVMGIVWANVVAVGLTFASVMAIALSGFEPSTLAYEKPLMFHGVAMAVCLCSTLAAVLIQLRGVYLAQLVSLVVGIAAPTVIDVSRLYLGIPVAWYEWLVIPVAAGLSFLLGLSIAGKEQKVEEVQFKPIDSWDRKAVASERVLPIPPMRRWNRLAVGVLVGLVCWNGIASLLHLLLAPLVRNPALLNASMAQVEHPLHILASFAAGMVAASGSTFGVIQGGLAGIVLLGLRQLIQPMTPDELVVLGIITIISASVGGVAGRKIFTPYRIFGNAKGTKNAPPRVEKVRAAH